MSRFNEIIHVLVLVDNGDIDKYFRLFQFLLGDRVLGGRLSQRHGELDGEEFTIHIHHSGHHMRGFKTHYVINLVQDLDLHHTVALVTTNPFSSIVNDPKWSRLFN